MDKLGENCLRLVNEAFCDALLAPTKRDEKELGYIEVPCTGTKRWPTMSEHKLYNDSLYYPRNQESDLEDEVESEANMTGAISPISSKLSL